MYDTLPSAALWRTARPRPTGRIGQPAVRSWYARPKPMPRANSPTSGQHTPLLLTVPEACAVLRISRWSLYKLIHDRQLVTVKIGNRRCIPAVAVRELIDRLQAEETWS